MRYCAKLPPRVVASRGRLLIKNLAYDFYRFLLTDKRCQLRLIVADAVQAGSNELVLARLSETAYSLLSCLILLFNALAKSRDFALVACHRQNPFHVHKNNPYATGSSFSVIFQIQRKY